MQISIPGVGTTTGVAIVDELGNVLGGPANALHVDTVATVAQVENSYDTPAPVAAFSSLTTIATIATNNRTQLNIELLVAVAALSAFEVYARCGPSGNYIKVASLAADFTTPKFPILGATVSPVTLAPGGAMFSMNCKGYDSIQLKAAGTLSTCTVRVGGQ